MRVRSRSSDNYGRRWYNVVFVDETKNPPTHFTSQNSFPNDFTTVKGQISDELNYSSPGSKATRRRQQAQLRRALSKAEGISDPILKNSVISDIYTDSLQVHKCIHTKKVLSDLDSQIIRVTTNNPLKYYAITSTSGSLVKRLFSSLSASGDSVIDGLGTSYDAGPYQEPDWFALLDRWNDACNSIIPSSSMLGESIVENAIFVDAFKTVLNPSHAIKFLFDLGRKVAKRKTTLGKVAASLRTSADLTLGYEFGVLPAISEIKNAFLAHRKVNERLSFLRQNRGGYVPIRVADKRLSEISPLTTTPSSPYQLLEEKSVKGVISGLGKVREDLNFVKEWQAYVQYFGLHKFIGLAWELVPFSFVVDWFTNAQEYVNKYTTPQFGSPLYNIRNICYSRKKQTVASLMLPPGYVFSEYSSTFYSTSPLKLGTFTVSSYERYPGLPSTAGSVDFSHLGSFQKFLLGTMLVQRTVK